MEDEGTATRPLAQSFIIKRPRLTKLLDESEARIILLVAPAGYGKTTLAREWLSGRKGVAWYSGRPAMVDVAALAAGLVTAFAANDERRDEAIERIQIMATRGQSPEVLAKTVASAVEGSVSVLVIDDCHYAASPDSEALLMALTLDTPLRVVLISRTRPAWLSPRMIIYGEATTLEMADLAFTNEEAFAVVGEGAADSTIGFLSRARGWPAVIGLAAQRGSAGSRESLPPSDLYDFFAEDLFRRATPDLQRGLILLALGGDANADVTRTMLGDDHDAILVAALEHGFLGQQTGKLEIHPLLRAFLLEQLDHLPAESVRAVVCETVEVLAANELWDECLAALECHPDASLISSILKESLANLLASGRIATVRRWVDLARANQVDDPMLLLAEAEIALRDRDDARAQILGAQAGDLLGSGDSAASAYIVAARAAHLRDDLLAVETYTELAFASTSATNLRATALWIEFASATERSATDAEAILERLDDLGDKRPEHALRVLNAQGLMLMNYGGDARAGAEKIELGRALIPHVRDPFLATNVLNVFAHIAVVLAQYERALALIDQMLGEARATGLDFALDHGLIIRASALIGLRRLAAAQRTLNEIDDGTGRASMHVVGNKQLQEVRLRIASGDLERASHLLQREPPDLLSRPSKTEFFAYRGLVFAALGEAQRADNAFRAAQLCEGHIGARFLCDLGKAVLALKRGDRGSEERCVGVMLQTVEAGHFDAIVMAARACPDLVRAGSAHDKCARALTQLLGCSSDVDLGRQAGLQMPRVLRRHERLSPRERDVYELIVQGRSNKAIARTLFISESTTKVHVRHIFEKLGVHTRAEVARTSLEELLP